jgi:hypothetical protein
VLAAAGGDDGVFQEGVFDLVVGHPGSEGDLVAIDGGIIR